MDYQLSQDDDTTRALGNYLNHLNPLPRSIIRDHDFELLDGEWRFAPDPEDRGLLDRWFADSSLAAVALGTASWPGSIEDHLVAAQAAAQSATETQDTDSTNGNADGGVHSSTWQDSVVVWYERAFVIPERWVREPDSIVRLTFGACGYETRVWLNGVALCTLEGEEAHCGGYTSFSYELPTKHLQASNRLTVRVAATMDAEIARGKQESRIYKRGGIWYQTWSGAVRSVWIEPAARNYLRSRLSIQGHIETGLVECAVTARIRDAGVYRLRILISERGATTPVASEEFELPFEEGERQQWVTLRIPDPVHWSPTQPALYSLVAQLVGPNGTVSQITGHIGLRQLSRRGHKILLNGAPIYFDGMLYQPGTANFEQMRRHMAGMKALGCNLVRVHIAGVDPRLYDLADEMGMLLWVEVPSPHVSSQRSRENHWAELQRMLLAIGAHPSIIICSLYNEDWGAQDITSSAQTRDYIARAHDYLRVNFPQLLVVDNDGWNHVSRGGRLTSDLLTAHIYTADEGRWATRLDRLVAGENQGVTLESLVVGDPFFYRGQMPVLVSEWGGFGFSEYGGPEDPESKAARIRAFKRALRERPICGDVYTQAVSIEQETNGVLDPVTGEPLLPHGVFASTELQPDDPDLALATVATSLYSGRK